MSGLYDEQAFVERESKCLGLSVLLHLFILGIMCFNFSWNTSEFEKSPPAILMVDLTNVKIADKTNLPPLIKETKKEEVKAPEVKKEEKKPESPKPQPKKEEPKPLPPKENKTPPVKQEAPLPKPEPVKPKEQPKKEAVKVQEKKPEPKKEPKKEVKKKEPKKEVKKETPKPQSKPAPKVAPKPVPKKQNQGLQSLLASVEKVRKPANQAPSSAPASSGQTVNNGIKGGTEGSLLSDLTISEKDLIASKISSCWNVNAGVENADKMIVELRAFINKDGSVREVKILNMKSDPVFRSMAESAKRAIYVCDALKEDSPFRILANKRPEMYSSWKEIRLRMNPVDGGVY